MSSDPIPITDTRPDRTREYEDFKPLLDRILVRRIEAEPVTDSFDVPDRYRQHSNWGEVVAVGDGVILGGEWKAMTTFVNVGDQVKYGEYTAERLSLDDESLWIVRLQDLRGVRRLKRE